MRCMNAVDDFDLIQCNADGFTWHSVFTQIQSELMDHPNPENMGIESTEKTWKIDHVQHKFLHLQMTEFDE